MMYAESEEQTISCFLLNRQGVVFSSSKKSCLSFQEADYVGVRASLELRNNKYIEFESFFRIPTTFNDSSSNPFPGEVLFIAEATGNSNQNISKRTIGIGFDARGNTMIYSPGNQSSQVSSEKVFNTTRKMTTKKAVYRVLKSKTVIKNSGQEIDLIKEKVVIFMRYSDVSNSSDSLLLFDLSSHMSNKPSRFSDIFVTTCIVLLMLIACLITAAMIWYTVRTTGREKLDSGDELKTGKKKENKSVVK